MRKELDCTHLLKLHDVFDNYKDVEQGNAEHYRMFIVTKYLSGKYFSPELKGHVCNEE